MRGQQIPRPPMKWAYGVTTVPERCKSGLLEKTLTSLSGAGFDKPRIFLDGGRVEHLPACCAGMEATFRLPQIRTFGNWILGLGELYIREPLAERYAMFQDDLVAVSNLRQYLLKVPLAPKTYWNLYSMPENEAIAPKVPSPDLRKRDFLTGFYESNQHGRGALALVFDRQGVIDLLQSLHTIERPLDPRRGHRAIDGGIVTALGKAGYKEMVHYPSLVQHTGQNCSSMGTKHRFWPLSQTFPGEGLNAMDLLAKEVATEVVA